MTCHSCASARHPPCWLSHIGALWNRRWGWHGLSPLLLEGLSSAPSMVVVWHQEPCQGGSLSMAMAYLELPQDGGDVGLIGQKAVPG